MGESPTPTKLRRRRIVERPRLLRALDDSKARVKLLVAGPGFGKTTLLEQWAAQEGRVVGWYRAQPSAADVSVVARALADAMASVLPGTGRRMLERLAITGDPEREADLLAEMLNEDLATWPREASILIDDYHHIARGSASDSFVESVSHGSALGLVIAGRARPSWIHGNAILDGRAEEVGPRGLAMTSGEIGELMGSLSGAVSDEAPTLQLDGWPLAVGLWRMVGAPALPTEIPEEAVELMCEWIVGDLGPENDWAFLELALASPVSYDVAVEVLGEERAGSILRRLLGLGLVDVRGDRFEVHSVIAECAFRIAANRSGLVESARERSLGACRRRHDWDAALEMLRAAGAVGEIGEVLSEALDDLLAASRIGTLQRLVEDVAKYAGPSATTTLAEGEIALRRGEHLAAQKYAEAASAVADGQTLVRARLLAGNAAHVGSREHDALRSFETAEALSEHPALTHAARWGRLVATTALELPEAYELLDQITEDWGDNPDASQLVRLADKRIALGLRFGAVSTLDESRRAAELLGQVRDPLTRCSFRSTFSCALNLAADYESAFEVATQLYREASELRLDYVRPYGALMQGAAAAGRGSFDEAHEALDRAARDAASCNDAFGLQGVYAGRIRALLHEGRTQEACVLEPPHVDDALPGMRGEVLASRALALACLGRPDEALSLARRAREGTKAIEAQSIARCVAGVVAVKLRADVYPALSEMLEYCYGVGAVDCVVTAYRANSDLLAALLGNPSTAEVTGYILARARDVSAHRQLDSIQRWRLTLEPPCRRGKLRFTSSFARAYRTQRSPSISSSRRARSRCTSSTFSTSSAPARGLR